jgi:hypothetical protein
MARLEEIKKAARNRYPHGLTHRALFTEGAKWADENPNLYNDEKYQTVKVSCLDELNRKAQLYDDSIKSIDEACEWIKNNRHSYKVLSFVGSNMDWDRFISEFRRAMRNKI